MSPPPAFSSLLGLSMLGVLIGLVLVAQSTPAPPIEPECERTLRVSVLDPSKPPQLVPGATVTVVPAGEGHQLQGVTRVKGSFEVDLRPGAYTVTVSLPGLKTQSRQVLIPRGRPKDVPTIAVEFRMRTDDSGETVLIDDTCAFDQLAELGSWRIWAHDLERLPGH